MAKLIYRSVGDVGAYPDWLRALKGSSGAYVIRELRWLSSPEIVYVGESHTGRLFQTITRHFQQWRRDKAWWTLQFGRAHDPGVTYPRGNVEVAVRVTAASRAIDTQAALMRRLMPRDNVIGWPADAVEEVPF
jgi:hypothetical protein